MVAQASNRRVHILLDSIRNGTLVPDPSFQRRLVWSNTHKSAFIGTVLRGYPFPEIYVAAGEVDLDTGQGKEMLVDGQQRLATLKQYFDGSPDLKLSSEITPYAELTNEEKKKFLDYPVVVRDLGQISMEEIIDIFRRINSTNYALNPMEIHNARFDGELKKFVEKLAQHSFFEDNGIFGTYEIRRMRDTTFTLSVIITVMSTYFNQDSEFENYLRQYNDEFEEKNRLAAEFQEVFQFIDKCGLAQNSRVLRQKSNLFTLLVEVHRALSKENENPLEPKEVGRRLQQFYGLVQKSSQTDDEIREERSRILEYYDATRQGTNQRMNRINRGKILQDVINGKFVFETILFEGDKVKRLFADIIIDVIKSEHEKYEREHRELGSERVPLANIHFGIVRDGRGNFAGIGDPNGNTGVPCLQEIAKIQGKPNENLLTTAQRMLDLFCSVGEIERGVAETYTLSKSGTLYEHLTQELGTTTETPDNDDRDIWTAERFRELISDERHGAVYERRGQIESLSELGADLMNFVAKNQWELTHKFRERNFSFYFGRRLVFGINLHAQTARLCVWVPKDDVIDRENDWIDCGIMNRGHEEYYSSSGCAVYPRSVEVADIEEMLAFAYAWRSGGLE